MHGLHKEPFKSTWLVKVPFFFVLEVLAHCIVALSMKVYMPVIAFHCLFFLHQAGCCHHYHHLILHSSCFMCHMKESMYKQLFKVMLIELNSLDCVLLSLFSSYSSSMYFCCIIPDRTFQDIEKLKLWLHYTVLLKVNVFP